MSKLAVGQVWRKRDGTLTKPLKHHPQHRKWFIDERTQFIYMDDDYGPTYVPKFAFHPEYPSPVDLMEVQ